jgi:transcriptional regulator with XRE-family HTH domain
VLGITQPSIARLEAAGDEVTVATLQRALNAIGRAPRVVPAAVRNFRDFALEVADWPEFRPEDSSHGLFSVTLLR